MTAPTRPRSRHPIRGCPVCATPARCIETRTGPAWMRRRYECGACGQRWTTREVVVHVDHGDDTFRGKRGRHGTERSIWA